MHPFAGTARFATIVEKCGLPEPVTLWVDPVRNRPFMDAVKADRVLTVFRSRKGRKETGRVGFFPKEAAIYLLFPKPLATFKKQRVIGIKLDLVQTPGPVGPVVKPGAKRPVAETGRRTLEMPRSRRRVQEQEQGFLEENRLFKVTIRFMAMVDVVETVHADSRKAAREQAIAEAKVPDMRRGTIIKRVTRVSQM